MRSPAEDHDPPAGVDSLAELPAPATSEGVFEDPVVGDAGAGRDRGPRGNRILTGPLGATVFWLALPVLLEQFLNFCVGACDMWLAGHLPDPAQCTPATVAVGVAAYVGWLASMLFAMVAAGTTALVARHWGAAEPEAANRVANRSLAMSVVAGLGFAAGIWPTAPLFAQALQLDAAATAITVNYLRLDGLGLIFTAVSLVAGAALRGAGDTRTPMSVFAVVSVVNLIVSASLVYGWGPVPAWGVHGIVVGTLVARLVGGVLMLRRLARAGDGLNLKWSEWTLAGRDTRRILRIGLPAAVDGAILWTGHYIFLRIINQLGTVPLAAHMVGVRIEALTYLPAVAWGAAAATMVGQALGNQDVPRARRAGHAAVGQCSLLGIGITLSFTLAAEWIFARMHTDPQVQQIGAEAFPIVGVFQLPLLIGIIYSAALRGAGDTRFPLIVTAVSTYGLRLPLAWWLGIECGWGLFGAWAGMCVDMAVRGALAAARFLSDRWVRIDV